MALTSGTHLGPYQIISIVGSGGMGDVYRAHDERIGRDVAIKILPASFAADSERLRRFEQEARAAGSLNHPNILSIYDIGNDQGCPYLVSELLDGETLRSVMGDGPIKPRRAVEYALQIAHGLTAAHEKGIIHRDLKPENIFVRKDGSLKILDFGLAKLIDSHVSGSQLTRASTVAPETQSGVILGTVVYMSPEQIRGERVDHRSDLFAFGVILFEMLSGKRPFQGESSVEVMHAILKEEAQDLTSLNPNISPSLDRIIMRCLEKKPDQRFQSASDLAFALEALSGETRSIRTQTVAVRKRFDSRLLFFSAGALLLALIAFFAGRFFGGKQLRSSQPQVTNTVSPFAIHQVTFRRGLVLNAKFGLDGQTIIYDAEWNGAPSEIFFTQLGNRESRSLGLKNVRFLSVSRSSRMAILLKGDEPTATLAEVSFTGGSPRPIAENVSDADWSPDGQNLAILRGRNQLEYPIGKVLYKTGHGLFSPRFSPKGNLIAFVELREGGIGTVSVMNLSGKVERLCDADMSRSNTTPRIAWAPSGDEIWFAAKSREASGWIISTVTLSRQVRRVLPMDRILRICDISQDGRILLSHGTQIGTLIYYPADGKGQRDLSWLDTSTVSDVSDDGKTILFTETGEGSGATERTVYLRNVDTPEPIRLGDGWSLGLSPDKKWALTYVNHSLVLLPTAAGQPKTIPSGKNVGWGYWFPEGKRILFEDAEAGHESRLYVYYLTSGAVKPATEEGIRLTGLGVQNAISPDGKRVIVEAKGEMSIYSLEDSKLAPIRGLTETDSPIRWSKDGHSIFVDSGPATATAIYRIDVASGHRELWKQLAPVDPAGIHGSIPMLSGDGKTFVCTYTRALVDLYLIQGLK